MTPTSRHNFKKLIEKSYLYFGLAWSASVVIRLTSQGLPNGALDDFLTTTVSGLQIAALLMMTAAAIFFKPALLAGAMASAAAGSVVWKNLADDAHSNLSVVHWLPVLLFFIVFAHQCILVTHQHTRPDGFALWAGVMTVGALLALFEPGAQSSDSFSVKDALDISFCIAVFLIGAKIKAAAGRRINKSRMRRIHLRHVERALALQRRWIAQDLHDGLGSHIISTIAARTRHTNSDNELIVALELCLTELRMAVDQLVDEAPSLVFALAMVRHRSQPAFDKENIIVHWNIEESVKCIVIPPLVVRELRYIFQDALSNIIQHSLASEVHITLKHEWENQKLHLKISDNGQGIERAKLARSSKHTGRGLTGFATRARRINAVINIDSTPTEGTTISLSISIPSSSTQA